ncbi:MAG: type I DNA topoisomerase [Bacteroidota bacterium]
MSKNLVIVESPAKAKTIEKILGKDFTVKSSMGHVRDLAKGDKGVDIENKFQPQYEVSPDKTKVVRDLKSSVKKVDTVWLATDEDREGEAISWHLCKVLGLDENTTKRIVFREITKPAIQNAIQNPRTVDLNLVDAQQARRILDRLVGFELSSLLWKKVKGKLSAGRVQSVAVKLIVERERAIKNFETTPFYKLAALFNVKNEHGVVVDLKADLPTRFDSETDAQGFLEKCKSAVFSITNIAVRPTKRKPTAPFTTSTLQQEASRKLGFSVKRTMTNAQRLYEQGFITYMRTDSVTLSQTALDSLANLIENNYGANYLHTRQYKNKKSNAQEAHEAIRPSYPEKRVVTNDIDQQRLYDLIWKRTVASQMSEAQLEKTTVDIGISTIADATLKATGEVLKFDGFLKVYLVSTDDDDDDNTEAKGILPPLSVGQVLDMNEMQATERFTRPPARFTEAGLVKKLEELGIGRPSTYAPTISRIMEPSRGYIVKGDSEGEPRNYNVFTLKGNTIEKAIQSEKTGSNKGRLVATDLGMLVIDFLDKHFSDIMNYSFTAGIEDQFDTIAHGGKEWTTMLSEFYEPFHDVVQDTLENAERATGERILGTDPASGRTVLVRMSRYGPVAQIGTPDELGDEKPKYANLRGGLSLESVTYEEAIELFKLPRDLGNYEDKEVSIGAGRYGPYVKWGEAFISIPRDEDPLALPFEKAVELIEEKKKADAPVGTYKGKPYTKGKGRFGPFLKYDGLFVNIPKRFDPETLTAEEAAELIEAKLIKEANRYIHVWDDEKITVENGRWGPFIRFKKKKINLPRKEDGKRVTSEEAAEYTLEQIK